MKAEAARPHKRGDPTRQDRSLRTLLTPLTSPRSRKAICSFAKIYVQTRCTFQAAPKGGVPLHAATVPAKDGDQASDHEPPRISIRLDASQ